MHASFDTALAIPAVRFAGVARASGWKFDRWLDTVFMQRDLGEGDRTAPPKGR